MRWFELSGVANLRRGPDTRRLAEYLKALANQGRLELLHSLRSPRTVGELRLPPGRVRGGENPHRAMTHQALREHLAKLRAAGVVAVRRGERDGALVDEYLLNHQRLFAIGEELRALGELGVEAPPPFEPTAAAERGAEEPRAAGPRLLLVKGQGEGRVFPLRGETLSAGRGWVIGRKQGLAVSLDYDPFVSTENSEVVLSGTGYALLDLRSSRNGTLLNFRALPRGGSAPLANGDVVTVGKTHLLFRAD